MQLPQQTDKYAARVLMISFFLPMQLQAVVVIAMSLYFVARTFTDRQNISAAGLGWALALGALYLLYVAGAPFVPKTYSDGAWQLCGNRLTYFLFPFVFAMITPGRRAIIFNELLYFVYTCFLVTLVANMWFMIGHLISPTGFQGVNHVTYRIFFEQFTGLHPTYISMYLSFSLCILMLHGGRLGRMIKYGLFYVTLVFLISFLAKSPLIAMALIFLHYAWLKRAALLRYKWLFAGTIGVLIGAYTFIPFIGQRINEMTGISRPAGGRFTDNSINVRTMILSVDADMLKHYWLTGAGPHRMMHLLHVQYLFQSIAHGYNVDFYDPHNEYFYDWLSLGIAAVILLAAAFVIHFSAAIRRRQYIYLYLMLILFITFFTESVLTRQQGVIFYSVFTSLFFFYRQDPSQSLGTS